MENLSSFEQLVVFMFLVLLFFLIIILVRTNIIRKEHKNIKDIIKDNETTTNALYSLREYIIDGCNNTDYIKDKLDNSLGEKGERELDDFSNKIDEIIKILKSRSRAKKTTKAINKDK